MTAGVRDVTRVGFVGWGRMGGMMGSYARKAGWAVTAYDPSPEAREAATAAGVTVVDTVAEVAAACDLVLLVVIDDQQVKEAVLGPPPRSAPTPRTERLTPRRRQAGLVCPPTTRPVRRSR